MKITLLSLVLCLFCPLNMAAQGSDIGSNPEDTTIHQLSKKELRRQKVAKRNIHYNILVIYWEDRVILRILVR